MELASKYNPSDVESKWYQYWLDKGFFKSKIDGREPYTVVIPPPNVTGVLHMGSPTVLLSIAPSAKAAKGNISAIVSTRVLNSFFIN